MAACKTGGSIALGEFWIDECMHVLIVEDDSSLRLALAETLEARGWKAKLAAAGSEGLYLAQEYRPDVVIVDLGLPGEVSGMDLISELRRNRNLVPILILTARDRWQDKVAGLKAGADDYLVKSFHPEELLARLEALVRRAAGRTGNRLDFGAIRLDVDARLIRRFDQVVDLTDYEFRLLEYLLLRAGQVISRGELLDRIYAEEDDPDSNSLEVLIARVRRKIDPDGSLRPIETLRGRGYRFALGAEPKQASP
jgi:two-component system response regulator PhoP